MLKLPVLGRRSIIVAWDVVSWALAFVLFVLVRYDFMLSDAQWQMVITYTQSAIALQVAGGFALHLYLGRSRVGSFDEASTLGLLVVMVAAALAVIFFVFNPKFPRGVALMLPPLAMVFMAAGRWLFRTIYHSERRRGGQDVAAPALVYGAGDAGSQVARLVDTAHDAPYRLVGFVDDDPAKRFFRVRSYRMLGRGEDLIAIARQQGASAAVRGESAPVAGRRLDIQGMRAVAVLMVVAYHAGLHVPGGFIGVDVFFVISGFVITAMLQREWAKHGRIRFGNFYLRRFKRLTPALALTVGVTALVSAVLLSPLGSQQNAAQTGLGAILLSANIVIARTTGGYFDAPAETNPLLNTWSLSVEEQFYLMFPVVIAGSWALGRRLRAPRLAFGVVSLIGLVSFALAVIGPEGFDASRSWMVALLNLLLGFYSPLTRAWEFAVGALLALALYKAAPVPRLVSLSSSLLGSALLLASLWIITAATPFPGVWTLVPVVGTLLLLVAGAGAGNAVSRALATPVMTKIGDWSYSIYLWHWPFIVFARILTDNNKAAIAVAAVLSVVPAYASYRWVEEPIRAMEISSPAHLGRVVAATLVLPLALTVGLLFAAGEGFWNATVRKYQSAALSEHAGERAGCDSFAPLGSGSLGDCTWNEAAAGAPVYLVGDSNADHLSEAAIGAGTSLNRPVVISTTSNCPFLVGYFERTNASSAVNERCRTHVTGTMDYLQASEDGTVILAAADDYWRSDRAALGVDAYSATTDPTEKLRVLDTVLSTTVDSLKAAGHDVVVVQTIPSRRQEYAWEPTACSMLDILGTPPTCGRDMPLEFAETYQSGTRQVLATVAERTGARLVDPGPLMCPDGVCSVRTEDYIRLRDAGHISVAQSEALAPALAEVLASGR